MEDRNEIIAEKKQMFDSLTIVGVGLISGSFSLGLKDRGLVKRVIGVSRTPAITSFIQAADSPPRRSAWSWKRCATGAETLALVTSPWPRA